MPRKKKKYNTISALLGDKLRVQPLGKKNNVVTVLKPRRRKKSSEAQKDGMSKFSKAVRYAQSIVNDPKKKKAYERNLKGHRGAYQKALAEYMRGIKD